MPHFQHGELEIAFLDEGEGEPIVLVHGFASTKEINWFGPGWISSLVRAQRRVIALDNRGHGQSGKLYRPSDYHTEKMVEDVGALLDHLGVQRADVMGYSMGARIGAFLAANRPERVRSLILGGLGSKLVDRVDQTEAIALALEAGSVAEVTDPTGRQFRAFAEQTKSDLRALAACIRGSGQVLSRAEAQMIETPTLIAVGTKDDVAGSAQALALLLPQATVLDIPGRDHMLAVGDKVFKAGVLAFLERRP